MNRVPAENYQAYLDLISQKIPQEQVFSDPLHTTVYGTDASLYRITPKVVVKPTHEEELIQAVHHANDLGLPITIRTAGTSLSGQALSDSVLIALDWGFRDHQILNQGEAIRLEPGLRGGQVNRILAPWGRKIGPDPASINAAMIGGIINNNSSGMCCGIAQNSYQTLREIKLLFLDGTILNTADPDSVVRFKKSHAFLLNGLNHLRSHIIRDKSLVEKIKRKYAIKNTTGYSLNALVDFKDPIEILKHLIVGSEGTLAILLEVTLNTVKQFPFQANAFIIFDSLTSACQAAVALNRIRKYVSAAELMDRLALRSTENQPDTPSYIKKLPEDACALLVQSVSEDEVNLKRNLSLITEKLNSFHPLRPIVFTQDETMGNRYWKIRKGILPSIGQIRKLGTTYLIEDIALPIKSLKSGVIQLKKLFKVYGYDHGVIVGHVLDGNIHFVICQNLTDPQEIERYRLFTEDVVNLTLNLQGSLKAEHSTGRNMASFVEREWGEQAYHFMKEIKHLFDPKNLLNPDVLINSDPQVHLKNFKRLPLTHDLVDKCIECGFCESICPSKDLTLTPRQRIVANRYLAELKDQDSPKKSEWVKSTYTFAGEKTCTTCGLCETVCPVSINTGQLIKEQRKKNNSILKNCFAYGVAKNFKLTLWMIRHLLKVGHLIASWVGEKKLKKTTGYLNQKLGFPIWFKYTPQTRKIDLTSLKIRSSQKVVYFPSCLSRTLSPSKHHPDKQPLPAVINHLCQKAGYEVILPEKTAHLCCGMPFASKGFDQAAQMKRRELSQALLKASQNGDHPICIDLSPCTATMQDLDQRLKIHDSTSFANQFLIQNLDIQKQTNPITIHHVCSAQKMGIESDLIEIAHRCAKKVMIPEEVNCCGFAGDKGFTIPRLNQKALASLKKEIEGCDEGFSSSISCEIGLGEQSDIPYSSILYLLNRCSQKKSQSLKKS